MIQSKKPLIVNAKGMTNKRRMRADVDSSSSSTMPTAYRTVDALVNIVTREYVLERTSEDEMRDCEQLAAYHQSAKRLANNAQSKRDD